MASFALYQLLVSLLIGLAALACEPVLLRWGSPRRLIWAAALLASLAFPVAMSLTSAPRQVHAGSVLTALPIASAPFSRHHRDI